MCVCVSVCMCVVRARALAHACESMFWGRGRGTQNVLRKHLSVKIFHAEVIREVKFRVTTVSEVTGCFFHRLLQPPVSSSTRNNPDWPPHINYEHETYRQTPVRLFIMTLSRTLGAGDKPFVSNTTIR